MIKCYDKVFLLETKHTQYLFHVQEAGLLEHLYYGEKIDDLDLDLNDETGRAQIRKALSEKYEYLPGNTIAYDKDYPNLTLENLRLEMSSTGKGDYREPFIELIYADGSRTSDFSFVSAEVSEKKPLHTLPSSYDENGVAQQLFIVLKEKIHDVYLHLVYSIFEDCDVITRSVKVINQSKQDIRIEKVMSMQLDLRDNDWVFTHFNGAWAREMNPFCQACHQGKIVSESRYGVSGSRSNPFTMLGRKETTDYQGECYGFNLIYSGNHYTAVEVNLYGKLRIVSGIQPDQFSYLIRPQESFESPEAVMTYASNGYMQMSHQMHTFVREHIVRGTYKKKERPILLNSWEAAYFNFDEGKLLNMAKAAKKAGVELFVMDDGWFGERNDDTRSLGDWTVNTKKLRNGLDGLCQKLKELGLAFGLWVEPEMVNENSELYRAHPDWAMQIPGRQQSLGRNQMILDLTRTQVQDYVIDAMRNAFSSTEITYVKWDMNRTFTDCYAGALSPERQGEAMHRYMLGLYRVMKVLTEEFPNILFEGCASGGNRFDLGILCYMPQIWASDNTDAYCRAAIQTGYSYGYPLSVIGAHISDCPNHQTLRMTPLSTRFGVAAAGILGYECNLAECKKEEFEEIRKQIAIYKKYRNTFQFGTYYRIANGQDSDYTKGGYRWNIVSLDKSQAIYFDLQGQQIPNVMYGNCTPHGLSKSKLYKICNVEEKMNVMEFGNLINTVAPFHVKKDSMTHKVIAKFVKMEIEKEEYLLRGSVLMKAGFNTCQNYVGTGLNENVRVFADYKSRMYLMDEIEV